MCINYNVSEDFPSVLFGISHHGIEMYQLISEKLYFIQNLIHSNKKSHNSHS